jgi:hypothetical protein
LKALVDHRVKKSQAQIEAALTGDYARLLRQPALAGSWAIRFGKFANSARRERTVKASGAPLTK